MGVLHLSLAALAALAAQDAQEATETEYGSGASPWQAQIFSNFADWTEEELAQRDAWDLAHRCGGSLIA